MKSKKKRKYHTVGTVPISNRKIIVTEATLANRDAHFNFVD
jgi:hypothetical protein